MASGEGGDQYQHLLPVFQKIGETQRHHEQDMIVTFPVGDVIKTFP